MTEQTLQQRVENELLVESAILAAFNACPPMKSVDRGTYYTWEEFKATLGAQLLRDQVKVAIGALQPRLDALEAMNEALFNCRKYFIFCSGLSYDAATQPTTTPPATPEEPDAA